MTPSILIHWLIDQFHVSTPYEEVADEIVVRAARGGLDRRATARCVTQAVIAHRQNRRLAAAVQAGRGFDPISRRARAR